MARLMVPNKDRPRGRGRGGGGAVLINPSDGRMEVGGRQVKWKMLWGCFLPVMSQNSLTEYLRLAPGSVSAPVKPPPSNLLIRPEIIPS